MQTSRCHGHTAYYSLQYIFTLIFGTARKLKVPVYQLLGGKVRNKVAVYAWIGGDRPQDVVEAA